MNKRIRKKKDKQFHSSDKEDYSDFNKWLGRVHLVLSAWQLNLDMAERAKRHYGQ